MGNCKCVRQPPDEIKEIIKEEVKEPEPSNNK